MEGFWLKSNALFGLRSNLCELAASKERQVLKSGIKKRRGRRPACRRSLIDMRETEVSPLYKLHLYGAIYDNLCVRPN